MARSKDEQSDKPGAAKNIPPDVLATIEGEVKDLLRRYPSRTLRTREVAKLLFLTYDLHPSAQLVRHFTQQGSMTDIVADLADFWSSIRDKARLQVQGVGLPEDVLLAAGDLVQQLWNVAQNKAREELAADRVELERLVDAGRTRAADLEALREADAAELDRLRAALAQAEGAVAQLEKEKIVEQEARGAAERDAARAREQGEHEARERAAAEERFSAERENERQSRHRSEDRLAGEIRFAKIQIEESRSAYRDLQERHRVVLDEKNLRESQNSIRLNALREELGAAKLALSEATGRMEALSAENNRLSAQVEAVLLKRSSGSAANTQHNMREELVKHPAAFEVADMADASLEASSLNDGQGFRLVIDDGHESRSITPDFPDLQALEDFCATHTERYAAIFDGPGPIEMPKKWFWDH